MAAQPVALRHLRMVEVVGGVVGHAQALHDRLGTGVGDGGQGDDLFQAQFLKAEAQAFARALGGVAAAPERPGQAPGDLDNLLSGGRKMGLEVGPC